ncbi:inositol monophosphatase family protein [Halomarina litorea]|uniref:inositol monophosphatase family protein n=1 Tax=Halomarina litorea TaxID=2961595 RepID=UPI0020C553B5|nr:inositol monophosphatase [Halomarina sp. BCD28]
MDDERTRVAVAERAARAGAAVALDAFRDDIDVETKDGKTDVVTWADRRTQERVIEIIRGVYPDDAVVGEEEDALKEVPEEGPAWVVDPIDGTNNFVRDLPIWATSVAAVRDGEPVAAANVLPAWGDAYVAGPDGVTRNGHEVSARDVEDPEQCTVAPTIWWDFDHREEYAAACEAIVQRFGDMRRLGCAQATLSLVAAGGLDGTITNVDPNPWDSVAGAFMVERAGGTVTGLDGEPWRHDSPGFVASSGACHDVVLEAAREIEGDVGVWD